ncbi:MAG TPA: malto-oligosyltrehalose synthase, partial [Terriglobales bacterium]|nr:malto-oligosyltrehalose synthase [Terriglobales bacterium]
WPLILASLPSARMAELEELMGGLRELPPHFETDPERIQRRRSEAARLRQGWNELLARNPGLPGELEEHLQRINGTPGNAASFDDLHKLLEAQPYRLAHWRVSGEEINYRRFFDVNDLVALRMENPRVFAETHRMLRQMMAQGHISGMRIDHCDGLLNPRQYLVRLQMLYYAAQLCGPEPQEPTSDNGIELEVQHALSAHHRVNPAFYCVVEKILEPGESLPAEWPVDGTSGYDFIQQVNSLFIDGRNEAANTRAYERFIGRPTNVDSLLYDCKKIVMHTSLASEVNVLAHLLDEISLTDRYARDFTRKTLRDAIRETIACFPVYRSYIDERGEIFERDRAYIQNAIRRAKAMNTGTAASVFDFLGKTLLTEKPQEPDTVYRRKLYFILKFQQLTGPVMAKGLEDTAFYVYNRFVSSNEVGCLPKIFGRSSADFHRDNERRLAEWPNAMLATSTHDTKRSEDVRARLNVLSEIPGEWSAKVSGWRRLNTRVKTTLPDGRTVPDANEEYLLYQTLVGAWPFAMRRQEERAEFTQRIQNYMDKAIHEAKVNVSWINPDPQYSDAMRQFIEGILSPSDRGRTNFFLKRIEAFLPAVQFHGAINSLAQSLLKLTSPGVPDIYQGTESFDFSLVDPDNRRPVDFRWRRQTLNEWNYGTPARLDELLQNFFDGRIKMWMTAQALRLRNEQEYLFRHGAYLPLPVSEEKAEHLCAFARTHGKVTAITAVPRFTHTLMKGELRAPLGDVWGKAAIALPPNGPARWRNVITGAMVDTADGTIACRVLFADFPVALLINES